MATAAEELEKLLNQPTAATTQSSTSGYPTATTSGYPTATTSGAIDAPLGTTGHPTTAAQDLQKLVAPQPTDLTSIATTGYPTATPFPSVSESSTTPTMTMGAGTGFTPFPQDLVTTQTLDPWATTKTGETGSEILESPFGPLPMDLQTTSNIDPLTEFPIAGEGTPPLDANVPSDLSEGFTPSTPITGIVEQPTHTPRPRPNASQVEVNGVLYDLPTSRTSSSYRPYQGYYTEERANANGLPTAPVLNGRAKLIIDEYATSPEQAEEWSANYLKNVEMAAGYYADMMVSRNQVRPDGTHYITVRPSIGSPYEDTNYAMNHDYAKRKFYGYIKGVEDRAMAMWPDTSRWRDTGNPFYQRGKPQVTQWLPWSKDPRNRLHRIVEDTFKLGATNPFEYVNVPDYTAPKKGQLWNGIAFGMGLGKEFGNAYSLVKDIPGGALWAAGFDINDPNLGYTLWNFTRDAVGKWDTENNKLIKGTLPDFTGNVRGFVTENGLTLDNPYNLANAVNYYYLDQAFRKDNPIKKGGFFDSLFGKALMSVGIGALTGGVGNWLGPVAGGITGATLGGLTGGPIGAITGGLGGSGITNSLVSGALKTSGLDKIIPKFLQPSTTLGYSAGSAAKDIGQTILGEIDFSHNYPGSGDALGVGWTRPNPSSWGAYSPYTLGYATGGMVRRRRPFTESRALLERLMRQKQQDQMPVDQMSNEDFINYTTRRLPMASLVRA